MRSANIVLVVAVSIAVIKANPHGYHLKGHKTRDVSFSESGSYAESSASSYSASKSGSYTFGGTGSLPGISGSGELGAHSGSLTGGLEFGIGGGLSDTSSKSLSEAQATSDVHGGSLSGDLNSKNVHSGGTPSEPLIGGLSAGTGYSTGIGMLHIGSSGSGIADGISHGDSIPSMPITGVGMTAGLSTGNCTSLGGTSGSGINYSNGSKTEPDGYQSPCSSISIGEKPAGISGTQGESHEFGIGFESSPNIYQGGSDFNVGSSRSHAESQSAGVSGVGREHSLSPSKFSNGVESQAHSEHKATSSGSFGFDVGTTGTNYQSQTGNNNVGSGSPKIQYDREPTHSTVGINFANKPTGFYNTPSTEITKTDYSGPIGSYENGYSFQSSDAHNGDISASQGVNIGISTVPNDAYNKSPNNVKTSGPSSTAGSTGLQYEKSPGVMDVGIILPTSPGVISGNTHFTGPCSGSKNTGKNSGSFGSTSSAIIPESKLPCYTSNGITKNTSGNTVSTTHVHNTQEGKYTGTFGGAPGILGHQEKPGYEVVKNTDIIHLSNQNSLHTPTLGSTVHSNSASNAGTIAITNTGYVPSTTNHEYNNGVLCPSNCNTNGISEKNPQSGHSGSGVYGFGSSGSMSISNEGSGKYTGSFGGAPGIISATGPALNSGAIAGASVSTGNYAGTSNTNTPYIQHGSSLSNSGLDKTETHTGKYDKFDSAKINERPNGAGSYIESDLSIGLGNVGSNSFSGSESYSGTKSHVGSGSHIGNGNYKGSGQYSGLNNYGGIGGYGSLSNSAAQSGSFASASSGTSSGSDIENHGFYEVNKPGDILGGVFGDIGIGESSGSQAASSSQSAAFGIGGMNLSGSISSARASAGATAGAYSGYG